MDENKLKAIVEEVVNKAIDPIKEDLNGVKRDLSGVKEDLAGIKETQEDHTRRLETLAGDTEQLLMDVKGIRDKEGMYHSRNKREIDEIKRHLDLPIIPDIPQI